MRRPCVIAVLLALLSGVAVADTVQVGTYTLTSEGSLITTTVANLTDVSFRYWAYCQLDLNYPPEHCYNALPEVEIGPGATMPTWAGPPTRDDGYAVEVILSSRIFSVGGQQYQADLTLPIARSDFLYMPSGEGSVFVSATPIGNESTIPEPGSLLLVWSGIVGLAGLQRKLHR